MIARQSKFLRLANVRMSHFQLMQPALYRWPLQRFSSTAEQVVENEPQEVVDINPNNRALIIQRYGKYKNQNMSLRLLQIDFSEILKLEKQIKKKYGFN